MNLVYKVSKKKYIIVLLLLSTLVILLNILIKLNSSNSVNYNYDNQMYYQFNENDSINKLGENIDLNQSINVREMNLENLTNEGKQAISKKVVNSDETIYFNESTINLSSLIDYNLKLEKLNIKGLIKGKFPTSNQCIVSENYAMYLQVTNNISDVINFKLANCEISGIYLPINYLSNETIYIHERSMVPPKISLNKSKYSLSNFVEELKSYSIQIFIVINLIYIILMFKQLKYLNDFLYYSNRSKLYFLKTYLISTIPFNILIILI